MTRRSFFKSLSSAVVGCYLAVAIKLPKIDKITVDDKYLLVPNYWIDIVQYYRNPETWNWNELLKPKPFSPNMGDTTRGVKS